MMEGAPGTRGRKIRNSEKKYLVFSLPRTRRLDSVSRMWAVFDENSKLACIDSYWNQSFWSINRPSIIFPGIATMGEQDCEKRISSTNSFGSSKSNYSYARTKCEIPIRFIPQSSSPFVITLFSRETCSILVDQSYYHAPYLGRSKDVLDFAAQNLLEKSIRRFVEVFSSNRKIILSTEITISTKQIFFQRNFLKF